MGIDKYMRKEKTIEIFKHHKFTQLEERIIRIIVKLEKDNEDTATMSIYREIYPDYEKHLRDFIKLLEKLNKKKILSMSQQREVVMDTHWGINRIEAMRD